MIDFHEFENEQCIRACGRDHRKIIAENDLCSMTRSVIDGLPIRCVGEWSRNKIFLLSQYFGIFSQGMSKKWANNINYIEICCGPGRCVDRTSGVEIDGSALCILKHKAFKYLRSAFFFDFDEKIVDILNKRLSIYSATNAKAFIGDYNKPEKICELILKQVNSNSLNLVFIDPTDCSLPFTMISSLKQNLPHVDIIINAAVGTDFNRNIGNALIYPSAHQEVINKYINFLGSSIFFERDILVQLAKEGNNLELRNAFRDEYINSLQRIGYQHFGKKRIRHYYDIIFATSNERGLEFWEKATRNELDGQRTLAF
jgi:three-Cys-motif partner protein